MENITDVWLSVWGRGCMLKHFIEIWLILIILFSPGLEFVKYYLTECKLMYFFFNKFIYFYTHLHFLRIMLSPKLLGVLLNVSNFPFISVYSLYFTSYLCK